MKHRQLGCWAARPFGIVSNHVSRAPAADRDSSPLKFQPLLFTWKASTPSTGLSSLESTNVVAFADVLEASGFDGVWLSDLPVAPVLDPVLGLALIAGRTSRVKLGANVVPLGRNPFLLAKALAQLD